MFSIKAQKIRHPDTRIYGQKGHFSKNRNKNPKNELPFDFIFVYIRVTCDQ